MKIQSIQQPSFKAESPRFITQKQVNELSKLKELMDGETTHETSSGCDFTGFIGCLENKQNKHDTLSRQVRNNEVCLTANKTSLVIDGNNGKILSHNKPFYKSWDAILKEIDRALSEFIKFYDNPEIISKKIITISSFTEQGFKKIIGQIKKG